jgi:magnesium transporter
VVTHDDVIDIIHEEASEDMQIMVGAGANETADTPWIKSVRMRLPWLVINVLNSGVAAWVVHQFEGTIAEMAILAALMPIVANQAGNAGQQSLAVMIRQLAVERFDRKKSWYAVLREIRIGVLNGLIIGLFAMLGVLALTHKTGLAVIMATALGLDMVLGTVAGASFPLVLKELGRDPAQSSSIFLTTVTDSAGFFLFLGLAGAFLL